MIFSIIFESCGSKEIGRYFLGPSFDPFLKSGFSFACWQPSGNFDCRIERLYNSVIGSARAVAPSLRNFPAILSKPVAFEGSISSKSLRTLST